MYLVAKRRGLVSLARQRLLSRLSNMSTIRVVSYTLAELQFHFVSIPHLFFRCFACLLLFAISDACNIAYVKCFNTFSGKVHGLDFQLNSTPW